MKGDAMKDQYRAVAAFDYWPDDVPVADRSPRNQKHVKARADVPADVPQTSITWLAADGLIRKVGD